MRHTVVLLVLLWIVVSPAHAGGLHRCVDANGSPIFSDQPCEDLGASARRESAPASGAASTGRLHARTCARTPEGLLRGLKIALAAGDVNQISAFYHWPGIGTTEADEILKRMQQLIGRPLVSAELIRAHPLADVDGFQTVASAQPAEATAIELVQSRSTADNTQVRTTFALIQYVDCWWLHF
jgi:hypothetical protein